MGKIKCPACRGQLETRRDGNSSWHGMIDAGAECSDCGKTWCCDDDFAPLAYFKPRERLPTPEEEAAHRARHGEGVRVFARWKVDGDDEAWEAWTDLSLEDVRALSNAGLHCFESYFHIDGRPVAWPKV